MIKEDKNKKKTKKKKQQKSGNTKLVNTYLSQEQINWVIRNIRIITYKIV